MFGSRRRGAAALTALAFALVPASTAAAATFEVDDDGVQCPGAAFSEIQPAVDASGPGDTVVVCDGTYPGGVEVLGPQHSDLRLRAKVVHGATISGFGTPARRFGVRIDEGAQRVEVARLRFEGPDAFDPGAQATAGILVDAGGTASRIRDNAVAGRLTQSIGVAGRAQDVSRNEISEVGQEGITIGGSAREVTRNHVDLRSPASSFAVGIFVFAQNAGFGVDVAGNGVVGDGAGLGLYVENAFDDDIALRHNALRNLDQGIRLNDATGVLVAYNAATGGRIGIQADFTAFGNRFDHNTARRNSEVDCRDEVGDQGPFEVDNTWIANDGFRSDPPRICRPRS